MYRKSIVAMTAVVTFVFAALAAAPGDSCGAQETARGEKIAKELGLSAEQKAKLQDLRREMRGIHKEHMEKMKALRDKSKEELLKQAPNKDILYAYARENGELGRIMAEKEADHLLKVKAILTADQFKKLLSRDFRHRRAPGPDGPHDGSSAQWPHGKGPHGKCPVGGPQDGGPDRDE